MFLVVYSVMTCKAVLLCSLAWFGGNERQEHHGSGAGSGVAGRAAAIPI